MAYGYWKSGVAGKDAVFHLHFREHPFRGGYTVAAGLTAALDYRARSRFDASDLEYLAALSGNDGRRLFEHGFLDYLRGMELACDIDAVPEGTVVFPQEPILRIRGPIAQCQLLETPLLNAINFQTLIATKAARICAAAAGDPVIEFGLRRAQGIDGALSASWAAFVGGCVATSNVLAGKLFGIPVRGTHAHSWVMSFDTELEALQAYARAMPNNCVFLVDTYDTLEGVRRAVDVGRWLRARGHEMAGVRLDSGDLAYLSIEARRLLDEGGFPKAAILASNDLDEHLIESLKHQGAKIAVWGVGTKLITAFDQPALGGVYKLAAVRQPGEPWRHKIKLSEQAIKVTTPGVQQVRRFRDGGGFVADTIYDEGLGLDPGLTIIDPIDPTRTKTMPAGAAGEDLLAPVVRAGKPTGELPPLPDIQRRAASQLEGFHAGIKRLVHPHRYPVGLDRRLHELRTQLIIQARSARR
jgi:nicotinate phosphoribosyltransferase